MNIAVAYLPAYALLIANIIIIDSNNLGLCQDSIRSVEACRKNLHKMWKIELLFQLAERRSKTAGLAPLIISSQPA